MQTNSKVTVSGVGSRRSLHVVAAATLGAVLGATNHAEAQLVVGTDSAGASQLTLIDLSGVNPPRVLVQGIVIDGLTADNSAGVLYWTSPGGAAARKLYRAVMTTGSDPLTPEIIGSIAGSMGSLAWDSTADQLIAFNNNGQVWVLNTALNTPNPGAAASRTLLYTMPNVGTAFYGGDFDPGTNAFYGSAYANVQSPGQAPIGIYRLSKPLSSPALTLVTGYPDNAFAGFRGLAVGNGRVYIVGGSAGFYIGQPPVLNHVFNLSTGTYEKPPEIQVPGTLTSATWAPGLLAPPAGTNLAVSAGGPTNYTIPTGGDMKFSVHIENYGAATSGEVSVTVDLPPTSVATFASSTPAPTSATATQLTYTLPSIAGYGPTAYANIEIHLVAAASDVEVGLTATATVGSDTDLSNNMLSATSHTKPTVPATAAIKGIFSTDPTRTNSLIPGGNGSRFVDFYDPYASPDGSRWAMVAVTNDSTTSNRVLMRSTTGGTPAVLVRRAASITSPPSGTAGFFDTQIGINNAGTVVFSDTTYIAKTDDGIQFTDIARQGQPIPSIPGINYGSGMGTAHIFNNGQVGFSARSSPAGSNGIFTANGNVLLAQAGVTVPTGASGPVDNNYWYTGGSLGYANLGFDATGAHSMYPAVISTEPLNDTAAVTVIDGTVVFQDGVTELAPGITAEPWRDPVGSMGPGGTWLYADHRTGAPDFVVRGHGTTIDQAYKTGDAIFTGATEHWSDARSTGTSFNPADTFFAFNSDINGHYVIGGYTDSPDVYTDSVLVYDNRVVIARENDPVDLDGNGLFDDNVYIRSFVRSGATGGYQGLVAFTNDHAILVSIGLRDGEAALGKQFDGNYLWAVVRIPLPIEACNAADVAGLGGSPGGDGQLTVDDLVYFLSQFFSGNAAVADIAVLGSTPGHDGQITVDDLVYFLTQFFSPCGS